MYTFAQLVAIPGDVPHLNSEPRRAESEEKAPKVLIFAPEVGVASRNLRFRVQKLVYLGIIPVMTPC